MRNYIGFLVLTFVLFFMMGCAAVSPEAAHLLGRPVPDGRLMLLSGEDRALADTQGKNRGLLFWATWCAHSRGVISDFEDLARTYAHRGDTDFFAVSLDRNDDLKVLKSRIADQDLTTVIHVFSGNDVQDEAFLALKGDQVPYSVFIDSRGVVRFVGIGTGGLEDFLEKRLR
jgi:thiol-disulfide isomerase/thioredoxin